jgi:hypothetical protein
LSITGDQLSSQIPQESEDEEESMHKFNSLYSLTKKRKLNKESTVNDQGAESADRQLTLELDQVEDKM